MQSENGLLVDVGQVNEVVDGADVFVVGFANFSERLLVDTRQSDENGPMVRVVEPLGSVKERLFWLGKERGAFGMPKAFTFFAWPHSIGYLGESGVWDRIGHRLNARENVAVATQCDRAFAALQALERAVLLSALLGERWVTIWPPEPVEQQ